MVLIESSEPEASPPGGSVAVEVAGGVAALAIPQLMVLAGADEGRALVVAMALWTVLGALVVWRWDVPLPLRTRARSALLATVALVGASLLLPTGTMGVEADALPVAAVVALSFPAVVGYELFYRGAVYVLLERRWTTGAAIIGSAVPETLLALGGGGVRSAAGVLTLGALFGLSRATTGSLAPAIAARLLLAAGASYLML